MSQQLMFITQNSRLFQPSRMDFQKLGNSCLKKRWFLAIHASLNSFNRNIANKKDT